MAWRMAQRRHGGRGLRQRFRRTPEISHDHGWRDGCTTAGMTAVGVDCKVWFGLFQ